MGKCSSYQLKYSDNDTDDVLDNDDADENNDGDDVVDDVEDEKDDDDIDDIMMMTNDTGTGSPWYHGDKHSD